MSNREQFEKLPEIAKRIDGIYWNADLSIYQTEYPILFDAVGFINGAWYVFQEQQKVINGMLECMDDAIRLIDEGNSWDAKEVLK